jgi:hypothetical protein
MHDCGRFHKQDARIFGLSAERRGGSWHNKAARRIRRNALAIARALCLELFRPIAIAVSSPLSALRAKASVTPNQIDTFLHAPTNISTQAYDIGAYEYPN